MTQIEIRNASVARTFAAYPLDLRRRLMLLRGLILDTAAATPGVGEIEETLKWGEPAYLTSASKSGSTLRLGPVKSSHSQYALYFNCKTTLVDTFRTLFRGSSVMKETGPSCWMSPTRCRAMRWRSASSRH